jgi:cytochrome b involved in lipid metabolism
MSRVEFAEAIKDGQKLVLIDNLVLDVSQFTELHPGGKFVINLNVGRDISKFFFGGYSLENNTDGSGKGHNHSSYARMIVNDLAIAIYEPDIPAETIIVQQILSKS